MTQRQTEAVDPKAESEVPVRARLAGPARKVRRAATAVGVIGLIVVVGIATRTVPLAGFGLLVLLAGLSVILAAPRLREYLSRNLAAGGTMIVLAVCGLSVAALAESAQHSRGRPVVLLVFGAVALLGGALTDGVMARRFRVGLDHRGLGLDRARTWFDHTSNSYRAVVDGGAVAIVIALALLTVAVIVGDGGTDADGAVSTLAWVILILGGGLGAVNLASLILASRGAARPGLARAVATLRPEVLVHFSGGIKTLYQLEHWIPTIEASGRPWLLVCRERATFEASVAMAPEATLLIEHYGDLDLAVVESVGIVFYVNTGTKNNHVIRFERPHHVQLHHGESDKPPSGGKTMRLYDAHFVAGSAARARLEGAGVDSSRIFEVGRPVTDGLGAPGAHLEGILYAPTWEGAHADSDLSSLARLGTPLIEALLGSGRHVVFRPHPLTGTADPAAGRAMRSLADVVRAGGGTVDDGSRPLVESFAAAGLLVADVSSVLVDWYATGRPVLVTDVDGLGAEDLWANYPTTVGSAVIPPSITGLGKLIEESFDEDPMQARRAEAARQTLGEIGSAQGRFEAAVQDLTRSQ